MPLLDVQNITKGYGQQPVLSGINCTIHHGEIISIVGYSGCGKSTMLNMLGLQDIPTTGDIVYHNHIQEHTYSDIYKDDNLRAEILRKYFGFIYQVPYAIEQCSVLENVVLSLIIRGWKRAEATCKAKAMLEKVKLDNVKWLKYPSQLSGGERSRLGIARALVHNPEIIFADEPTGNLDFITGKTIIQTLFEATFGNRQPAQANLQPSSETMATLILITHSLPLAILSDRVFIIFSGRLHTIVDISGATGQTSMQRFQYEIQNNIPDKTREILEGIKIQILNGMEGQGVV